MAGFTFNFCVEEEEHVDNGATCFIEEKGACAEPLDKGDKRHSCCDTSIVAKCPGMTGTVPEFLHLSRSCPG